MHTFKSKYAIGDCPVTTHGDNLVEVRAIYFSQNEKGVEEVAYTCRMLNGQLAHFSQCELAGDSEISNDNVR